MTEPAAQRIILDPAVVAGKPIIAGTRMSVEFILDLLAQGWSGADVLENYPHIAREDIIACIAYARDIVKSERVYPSAA